MAKTPYEKTMTRAINLLGYKPRTVAEMRTRLLEKEWAEAAVVDQVIARLQELKYLDDDAYAANFAQSRLSAKPLGRSRLRRDLQRKKLPAQAVESALDQAYEERDEETLIEEAIRKRTRIKGPPVTPEDAKKLFDYLIRRGFGFDLARRKIRAVSRAVDLDE
ncbi:MAG: regulatory protein RecX [Blastocatellia bacterium]|nr:regulatory protein RecX [Blastocatellia bacterium]